MDDLKSIGDNLERQLKQKDRIIEVLIDKLADRLICPCKNWLEWAEKEVEVIDDNRSIL